MKTKNKIKEEIDNIIEKSNARDAVVNLQDYAYLLYQQGLLDGNKKTLEEVKSML